MRKLITFYLEAHISTAASFAIVASLSAALIAYVATLGAGGPQNTAAVAVGAFVACVCGFIRIVGVPCGSK